MGSRCVFTGSSPWKLSKMNQPADFLADVERLQFLYSGSGW